MGWFRYVNVIYIHNGVIAVMEREMAYTADVNRWRGPNGNPYRPPHMLQESPWHPGWIAVTILGFIIWWPIGLALLFFTLGSRKMGCGVTRIDGEQDGADAVQDGADARPHGASWLLGFGFGPPSSGNRAFKDTAPKRCGVSKKSRSIQRFPRSPASRQGQGRVRPVHGAAQAASDPAERPAAAESLSE